MKRTPIKQPLLLLFLSGIILGTLNACTSLTGQSDRSGIMQTQNQANQGDALSQYRMGLFYTSGASQDYKKAAKWFNKAARQDNQDAQYMLGIAYYVGRGIPRDYAESRDWFQKAADQGHARAQYQLGEIYLNGRGANKEPAWAALWYGKAAEQTHAEAQFTLGVVFARGLGLPVNRVRSCQWLILAEQSDQASAAAVRDKICTELTEEQQRRAKNLAVGWQMRTYPPYQDPPTLRYIQFKLQQQGYDPGYVDGVYGEQTRSAMQRYLSDSGTNSATVPIESLVARLRKQSQSL